MAWQAAVLATPVLERLSSLYWVWWTPPCAHGRSTCTTTHIATNGGLGGGGEGDGGGGEGEGDGGEGDGGGGEGDGGGGEGDGGGGEGGGGGGEGKGK